MLNRSAWFLTPLSLLLALPAGKAQAKDCGDPKAISQYDALMNPEKGTPSTDKVRARLAFLKYIDQKHSNDGGADVLYFVLPVKTKTEEPEIVTVPLPRDADHYGIDQNKLDILEKYPEVQVFNKSGNPAPYFLPYTEQGLKGAIPEYDFRSARQNNRQASGSCSIVSFKKGQIYSIVGNNIATWGDKVADTQRNAIGSSTGKMAVEDATLYLEAVGKLKDKFKGIKIPGRNLAIANADPYGSKIDNRLEKILKEANGRPINFRDDGVPFIQKTVGAK